MGNISALKRESRKTKRWCFSLPAGELQLLLLLAERSERRPFVGFMVTVFLFLFLFRSIDEGKGGARRGMIGSENLFPSIP